jgi:hypothetical protein
VAFSPRDYHKSWTNFRGADQIVAVGPQAGGNVQCRTEDYCVRPVDGMAINERECVDRLGIGNRCPSYSRGRAHLCLKGRIAILILGYCDEAGISFSDKNRDDLRQSHRIDEKAIGRDAIE